MASSSTYVLGISCFYHDSAAALLKKLGLRAVNPGVFCGHWLGSGKPLESLSPIDGRLLATVRTATTNEYERTARRAREAFLKWQIVPAPRRGEIIRQMTVDEAARLIEDGVATGGMIPKLETAIAAVDAGVEAVVILDGRPPHAMLTERFTSHGAGTLIRT